MLYVSRRREKVRFCVSKNKNKEKVSQLCLISFFLSLSLCTVCVCVCWCPFIFLFFAGGQLSRTILVELTSIGERRQKNSVVFFPPRFTCQLSIRFPLRGVSERWDWNHIHSLPPFMSAAAYVIHGGLKAHSPKIA